MAPEAHKDHAEMLVGRKPTVRPITVVDIRRAAVMSASLIMWMVGEFLS